MAHTSGHALSNERLIVVTWLCGAVTLVVAVALNTTLVRTYWLEMAVLIWLAPLAVYDLRQREVPHMACVAVPCAAAVAYSIVTEAWMPGVMAVLAVSASERQALPYRRARKWVFRATLLLGGAMALVSGEVAPGAFAILGFWLAYEAGWWAGADALAAITLALLWPDAGLLMVLGIAHLCVALGLRVLRFLRRTPYDIGRRGCHSQPDAGDGTREVPGLPVIGLATVLHVVWRVSHPAGGA